MKKPPIINPIKAERGRIMRNITPSSKSMSFKGRKRVNAIGTSGLNNDFKILIIIIQNII
jgi:hypothetical protein